MKKIFATVLAFLAFCVPAKAELSIDVSGAMRDPMPIAIPEMIHDGFFIGQQGEKIRKVIRDCVPEMVGEQLEEDTVINTETAIDSMGFILVICKLEAMFDVKIPERQWKKLSTMGDVADAIMKYLPRK